MLKSAPWWGKKVWAGRKKTGEAPSDHLCRLGGLIFRIRKVVDRQGDPPAGSRSWEKLPAGQPANNSGGGGKGRVSSTRDPSSR